jgi:hypothetical protein
LDEQSDPPAAVRGHHVTMYISHELVPVDAKMARSSKVQHSSLKEAFQVEQEGESNVRHPQNDASASFNFQHEIAK